MSEAQTLHLELDGHPRLDLRECNAKKQGGDWRDFIIQRAGPNAAERHAGMLEFLKEHDSGPAQDLRDVAGELYEDVGEIPMTLIRAKTKKGPTEALTSPA